MRAVLRDVVNLLISGKVPVQVARFLAGGNLVALEKNKPNCPPDIRPIAVGEAIRRLAGKCLCVIPKEKAHDFLAPLQLGVVTPAGAEKIIHGLRGCVDEHWHDADFAILKIHFPELLPWSSWCYGQHPALWHPLGTISSEIGVQQGDPLGPLLFCLVLQQVVSSIAEDPECASYYFTNDGGPPLGLYINITKCELFSLSDLSTFPDEMKRSNVPHFEILGASIGDLVFCATFVAQKQSEASKLLQHCKHGGDVVSRHNKLRDVFLDFCQRACLGPRLEMGCGAGYTNSQSRPADVLVPNWDLGKPAAFDLSVTSMLHPSVLLEASMTAGSAALVAENRKHKYNDRKCEELGWVFIPLVVETYGCWGAAAVAAFSKLAGCLSTRLNQPKSKTIFGIYSRLGIALVRANCRAILSRLT
eukprot:Em0005g639a